MARSDIQFGWMGDGGMRWVLLVGCAALTACGSNWDQAHEKQRKNAIAELLAKCSLKQPRNYYKWDWAVRNKIKIGQNTGNIARDERGAENNKIIYIFYPGPTISPTVLPDPDSITPSREHACVAKFRSHNGFIFHYAADGHFSKEDFEGFPG
jgi:hypothetical protein